MIVFKRTLVRLIVATSAIAVLTSCGNRCRLKSVGVIDLDEMMADVEQLVVLTIYQNELLPEKFNELYSAVMKKRDEENRLFDYFVGDIALLDRSAYKSQVYNEMSESYVLAWENIKYIALNNIPILDFHMGDIDDEYAPQFIEYYYETAEDVLARVVLGEPNLIKDEATYATFIVENTMTATSYLVRLSPKEDSEYNIEVSEL